MIKMRQEEKRSLHLNKLNESLNYYQERSQAYLINQTNNDEEAAKRIKKALRDQDQRENLKRILMT